MTTSFRKTSFLSLCLNFILLSDSFHVMLDFSIFHEYFSYSITFFGKIKAEEINYQRKKGKYS
ncbi:hypothetical protein HMPREF1049_0891 [Fusobacterium necrophorum subsp. funduliforme ATCC 51357]|uniref:Uncharacterized protein n=2 Tax=Fusobacterium necrophorum TaxID=859 RepID=A0AAN4AT72_9FUSO|nr:hypothetical protein BSQ88_03630 [Fusobacterium necrophorum subsp. funduliforme]EIJ72634.1 hypothetical protein HMPREF1049_0891 [Fusobacterium necrophorum subsp. funduliforme ATCC 51357]EJU17908.1 hypothetical protein HMPREF1127_1011 [Fusobacterium necrophorum subsp. funduliforme Fnf 1007]RXZ27356.1 hypothetical protein EPT55_06145 [Fusobacterium necrophorum]AYV94937.1 hypothetical protein BWX37_04590 [Fusobacterium necrophorum subsp. funduliforme]